jgi:diguanylate cyclase (GGDEF)-like protein
MSHGDECLQTVAHALQAGLIRAGDLVARFGGEEFAVLLPWRRPGAAATWVAERLRAVVWTAPSSIPSRQAASVVTVSIGLTVMEPGSNADFETLYQQADAALYRAKAMGRNRVECHVPPSFPTPGAVP